MNHLRRRVFGEVSEYQQYRLLEMLPGVLVWSTFVFAITLSFVRPLWAIFFIILFDLYWLVRVVYLLVYLIVSYRRYRTAIRIDWLERLSAVARWERLYHLIMMPTAGEPEAVIRDSFEALRRSDYPKDRLIVVFALEERKGAAAQDLGERIRRDYEHVFGGLLVTTHPDGVIGEVKGKGANIAWAGRRAQEYLDRRGIPYDDVIVSSFDIDTQPHPRYFSCLAYHYATHPKPTRTSFQPVPLYNNNLWQSPALMRVAANSTTFWLMTEQVRPERLLTFSSHSMSFRALVDVDFWQSDIVTEDSRIFLQCLLRYDGDYSVTPIYLPLSMDTVLGKNLWRSLVNLYKQQRRWAYGVENFPYMAWYFAQNRIIPFRAKFRYVWNQLEGVYSWATAPILIFILGRLPLMVGGERLSSSLVAHNAPLILQWLMTAAMIGLFVSAVLSTTLLPPRPERHPSYKIAMMVLQWILFPVVMILFGSVPATDAQTRLMLGKYLGFWVTEKTR
ncbi:MAG: glycosyltransferase family 2 protein [Candidatus Kerfeldbacteria bacterium]|nr:glycosyltransferase family 2 protein [Candidatus Kerfeldbacteria bacterium]